MFHPTKEWVNKVNLSSFELENFFKFVLAWLAREKPNNLTPQCAYLSANRFSMAREKGILNSISIFRFSFSHDIEKQIWILLFVFRFRLTLKNGFKLRCSFFVFTSLFNKGSYMTNNMMIAAKKHLDFGAAIATLAYPRWGRKMTNIWRLYTLKSQNARWYSKTKVMLTGTHQRLTLVDSFIVRAGDTVLSRVYQFKYLGVMLDPSRGMTT